MLAVQEESGRWLSLQLFYGTVGLAVVFVPRWTEVLSSPQVDFRVHSTWTQWQSPALNRTTCLHHFSASSWLVSSSWPSRWYSILQKLSSVSVFSLSSQLLRWNFRKCQIQPGLRMTDRDAIPTTEECKNCGNPSAEELGESKGANRMVNSEPVMLQKSSLLPKAALLFWQHGQTAAGGSLPAWLRQCSHLLQSYQKLTSELHISIHLEEGLLNDDHELNPTKKWQSNFFGMWKSISGLSPFPSSSSVGVGLLLPLLLIVSDCTEDVLQNHWSQHKNFLRAQITNLCGFLNSRSSSIWPQCARIGPEYLFFRNRKINFNMKLGTDFKRIIPVIYVLAILS